MRRYLVNFILLCSLLAGVFQAVEAKTLVVGSKNFTESYILSEIVAQLLESRGFEVDRKFGLGGTLICYEALVTGEIDVYVEYTGTLSEVILAGESVIDTSDEIASINTLLTPRELEILPSFGFNNTYALALKQELADKLGISSISQLMTQTGLRLAFSHEFLEREDGWPGLQATYRGDADVQLQVRGIEHGLAYQALEEGSIDVTDAYSTDGELSRYKLQILADDKGYFPQYLAVPFLRKDLPKGAREVLLKLASSLDESTMQALNENVVFAGASFSETARNFLSSKGLGGIRTGAAKPPEQTSREKIVASILNNTKTHLKLTGIALLASVTVGILLSLLVYRITWLSRSVIYVAGLLQTIPSIALLALMIPLFGIGQLPAVIALFFYSLLPVIRNTITALVHVDPLLKRVAIAIGLEARERLRYVYLPLALPSILSGIRTATVISIGTATLAAFIGAGGLGDPIVTGLALNNTSLILQGAIPAAILALVSELLFELVEKLILSRYLTTAHSL